MAVWEVAHVGAEGDDFALHGLKIWKQKWRRSPIGAIPLPSPDHPSEIKLFDVYDIGDDEKPVRFAVTEVSNGIFAFYAQRPIAL